MTKLFLNSYANTQLMCVYCEGLLPEDAKWCEGCQEYKGVMTITDFQKTYGEEY
jgi:RNA polymerase subunit RPABC4/transcription elongation factor Spt4